MKKILNAIEFYAEEIISLLAVVAFGLILAWTLNPDNIRSEIERLDAIGQIQVQEVQEVKEYEKGNFYDLQDEPIRFWQQCWNLNDSSKEELV